MTVRRASLAWALMVAAGLSGVHPALADPMNDMMGRWRDSDGESQIAIVRCGSALCGRIAWLKQPRFDDHNPDARLRSRSLVGVKVLMGFAPDSDGVLVGSGYNPVDGRIYRTTLELKSPNSLTVRGCVLGNLLCDDDVWTRVQ